jgi:hypothetical protein
MSSDKRTVMLQDNATVEIMILGDVNFSVERDEALIYGPFHATY